MDYSNSPTISIVDFWIPDDIRTIFDIAMIVFVVCFFIGVHYRMHVIQHFAPPPYLFQIREWIRIAITKIIRWRK